MAAQSSTLGNLVSARVQIKGTRILLWNHFGPHALPLEPQERDGIAGNDPQEWRRSVLMNSERELYLLPSYCFRCLREGGKFLKQGRSNLEKAIASSLRIQNKPIYIDGRSVPQQPEYIHNGMFMEVPPEVFIDVSGVVNPSTRKRNIRYRVATASGWTCSFTMEFDKTIISRSQMHSACIQAGALVGLGDARQIGLGRFDLVSFEISDTS